MFLKNISMSILLASALSGAMISSCAAMEADKTVETKATPTLSKDTFPLATSLRTPDINQAIEENFKKNANTKWFYSGREDYGLMRRENDKLIIGDAIKAAVGRGDKTVVILDIGGGNHAWAKSQADYIETIGDFPEGLVVKLISVTGDNNIPTETIKKNRSEISTIGGFKIEDLYEQLSQRGYNLENKVHLVVSRYTFIHLTDPYGTFLEALNLLCKEGNIVIDGFPIFYNGQWEKKDNTYVTPAERYNKFEKRTRKFLEILQAPFKTERHPTDEGSCKGLSYIQLKRTADTDWWENLAVNYDKMVLGDFNDNGYKPHATLNKEEPLIRITEKNEKKEPSSEITQKVEGPSTQEKPSTP